MWSMVDNQPLVEAIVERVAKVRERIAEACRRVGRTDAPQIVAVTKNQDPEVLPALAGAGLECCGENRIDHLRLMHDAAPPSTTFAYIGRVQGRQLTTVVACCTCLHSLAEIRHVARLAEACRRSERRIVVFLQANTSGEAQKAGVSPEDLPALLEACRAEEDALEVIGLMTMAPDIRNSGDDSPVRRTFAALRTLAETHALPGLSMGMSTDFEIAVEEGATHLRLGTILFPS